MLKNINIIFLIIIINTSCSSENSKRLKNISMENQICLTLDNFNLLKDYIEKNGSSLSSVGPPYPVTIDFDDTTAHNRFVYTRFYYQDLYNKAQEEASSSKAAKYLDREEIKISIYEANVNTEEFVKSLKEGKLKFLDGSTENDSSYTITLKAKKVIFNYKNPTTQTLQEEYEKHFCNLIKQLKNGK